MSDVLASGSSGRRVVEVFPDASSLAAAVAQRLVSTLADIQGTGRTPSWVLTGGSIATRVHAALGAVTVGAPLDWTRVRLWWGDERFLPSGDSDRNETAARAALLDHLPLDAALVHPMPAADGDDDAGEAESAAAAYAAELGSEPAFDVLMLGVGPDGHVASLFPGHPALSHEGMVAAVTDAPKPPPVRLSLTMPALCRAEEVWFVAAGADKAAAVHRALDEGDVRSVPAAGPRGRRRTVWFVDGAAAAQLARR